MVLTNQPYEPVQAHNRFTNCTKVLKTTTRFGAQTPSQDSLKYNGAHTSMHVF